MSTARRPGALEMAWSAGSGGLFGGSAVGIAEAVFLLSRVTPSEYQALPYAAGLYGLVGAFGGAAIGVVLAVLSRRLALSTAFGWSSGFVSVAAGLGAFLLLALLDRSLYGEQGVPEPVRAAVVGGAALAWFVGLWLSTIVLTKTPLRVLAGGKGTIVGWAVLAGLAFVFSLAPPPGAAGDFAPHRPQPPDAATRPDVVLIHVDTLRADALGVYGAPPDATPALDAFAADALVFEQAVSSSSWTRPAIASLFTSLPPSSHACAAKSDALSPLARTLAEVLQDAGYATGGFPNNVNVTGALGFGQGFDYYPYAQVFPLGAEESTYGLSLYQVLRRLRAGSGGGHRVEDYYVPAEAQVDRAVEWLHAQGSDRSFLYLHLMDPHDPYFAHPYDGVAVARAEDPVPDPSAVEALRALYAGEVRYADAALGRLFAAMRESGAYDRSVIVVTADHGEEFLDHGGWWHGTTLYDEQVHVPLLVKLPGSALGGRRVPWQVRTIDVAPTLAELANVAVSPSWRGVSLVPDDFDRLLAWEPPALPEGSASPPKALWAIHPGSREALSELDFEGYVLQSLRATGRKLITATAVPAGDPHTQRPVALYDLAADPAELDDLADGDIEAPLVAWLERKVAEARSEAVTGVPARLSEADRARLESLDYLDAAAPPSAPAPPASPAARPE